MKIIKKDLCITNNNQQPEVLTCQGEGELTEARNSIKAKSFKAEKQTSGYSGNGKSEKYPSADFRTTENST